jgi:hypothetical protein
MAITKKEIRWNPETKAYDTISQVVTHVGRVLEVYPKDFQVMSDVYALAQFARVVDDDGVIRERLVHCTDLDGLTGTAEVDATPECLEIAAAHDRKIAEERRKKEEAAAKVREEEERNRPTIGKRMIVARGRKVPKGTTGTVAFVNTTGSVLLKDDAVWQDRGAPGVWVHASYLRAR